MIELQVQFDLVDLLNHDSNNYTLPVIASLPEEKFGLFYKEVIKLFNKALIVKTGSDIVAINKRYPTQAEVFDLIKTQFIESTLQPGQKNVPYTFDDRRFYQVFLFDFRVNTNDDLDQLEILFPKELGNVYTTFSQSINKEIHKGDAWIYYPVPLRN